MTKESAQFNDTVQKGVGRPLGDSLGLNSGPEANVFIDHIRDGEIIDHREYHNMISDAGKAIVAGLMLTDVGGTAFDYIAIGIGTTGETHLNTALESEIASGGGSRVAGTGTRVTTNYTNDTAQLVVTYNFTLSFAVTESGVFNASSGPTLLCRKTFSAINVVNGDSLQVTWKVVVSASI